MINLKVPFEHSVSFHPKILLNRAHIAEGVEQKVSQGLGVWFESKKGLLPVRFGWSGVGARD